MKLRCLLSGRGYEENGTYYIQNQRDREAVASVLSGQPYYDLSYERHLPDPSDRVICPGSHWVILTFASPPLYFLTDDAPGETEDRFRKVWFERCVLDLYVRDPEIPECLERVYRFQWWVQLNSDYEHRLRVLLGPVRTR